CRQCPSYVYSWMFVEGPKVNKGITNKKDKKVFIVLFLKISPKRIARLPGCTGPERVVPYACSRPKTRRAAPVFLFRKRSNLISVGAVLYTGPGKSKIL